MEGGRGPIRVLVIEDEKPLRELLAAVFADPRWRVSFAADGIHGVEMARKERPDVVITDLVLPGMSGWEVCQALRQDPATQHSKIIVLSALIQDSHKRKAFQLGANAYIEKPFRISHLLETVTRVLSKR
jgi:DNA-binding response OmpR family regulator